MRLTVVTNLHALERITRPGVELTVVRHVGGGIGERLRRMWANRQADYAVINCSPNDLFYYCFFRVVAPFSRVKVVSLDTVLPIPRAGTWPERLALFVKRHLFRRVHLFIEYFRDTQGYERHYRIPGRKFRYVPFKINRYERVLQTPTSDEGYIFCGGNTRRDFQTLLTAVDGLPYKVRIVTMGEAVIQGHGSSLDERTLPANVEVVRHDGSDSFLDFIARARLVVLPIKRSNISASGIGVYLASMALGKCVIISAGPAVNRVVPDGAAVIVPPEDPAALRAAIVQAYADRPFREAVAAAGRAYALSLGGEDRLCGSVVDVLVADCASDGRASHAASV